MKQHNMKQHKSKMHLQMKLQHQIKQANIHLPYHVSDDITEALNNTGEMLLDKTCSRAPMFNSLYKLGPGLELICQNPAIVPKHPARM